MRLSQATCHGWLPTLLTGVCLCCGTMTRGEEPAASGPRPVQVAERSVPVPNRAELVASGTDPNEHPLAPALRWAYQGLEEINRIQDYSATVVKRERIAGKLGDHQYMFAKVRQKPFSVYLYFLDPPGSKGQEGQEVIYVEGQNNGKLQAHLPPGLKNKLIGTVSLDPTSALAMQGQRYPITELGVATLVRRLVEVGEHDSQFGECEVNFLQGTKINGRPCTRIQVVHPTPRRNFLFHIARIYVDEEMNIPVRYESHDWPTSPGGQPELMEEYTYLNVKLNNGFTDADFDVNNPNYRFKSN